MPFTRMRRLGIDNRVLLLCCYCVARWLIDWRREKAFRPSPLTPVPCTTLTSSDSQSWPQQVHRCRSVGFMLCHLIFCHVIVCHVAICHVIICHVIICHVIICHGIIFLAGSYSEALFRCALSAKTLHFRRHAGNIPWRVILRTAEGVSFQSEGPTTAKVLG